MVLIGEQPAGRSRLRLAGATITIVGVVCVVLGRLLGSGLTGSPLLEFVLTLPAFGVLVGPALWFVGRAREGRAAGGPVALASAALWIPIALALVAINFMLGVHVDAGNVPQNRLLVFVVSRTVLVPGIFALVSLIFAKGRCLGRAAKVFSLFSLLVAITYLSP